MRLVKLIQADTITPVSAYLRLKSEQSFFLESMPNDRNTARYSIIALNPAKDFTARGNTVTINGQTKNVADPLAELNDLVVDVPHDYYENDILPFQGGAIGYVGFDAISLYENIGEQPIDDLNMPDIHMYLYETFIIFDHQTEKITVVVDNNYTGRSEESMQANIQHIEDKLQQAVSDEFGSVSVTPIEATLNYTKAEFMAKVERAKELITAGDMFQIVLSQRFDFEFKDNPFDFYRLLRASNPSPYMYYLDFGSELVIGASPESLVTVRGNTVTTNPIAGTRKRKSEETDDTIAADLRGNKKEVAEHSMLVDLGRNDLARVSTYGSVQVDKFLEIEKYRYVMHLVSKVSGTLRPDMTAIDALKATLPAGTLSGAPKIRALQRIYELENVKRGVYGGAIGYLSRDGQLDFAIAIRTMVLKDKHGYVQAGAGIVYDSIAENEYMETFNKAKALLNVAK